MKAKKGYPIQLPPFDWDENAFDWKGRLLDPTLTTMPLAYTAAKIVDEGFTIIYQSPLANASESPVRVPCISYGRSLDMGTISASQKKRLDDVGLIQISNPFGFNAFQTTVGDSGPLIDGLPLYEVLPTPVQLKDPSKYIGGKLLLRTANPTSDYITFSNSLADLLVTSQGSLAY